MQSIPGTLLKSSKKFDLVQKNQNVKNVRPAHGRERNSVILFFISFESQLSKRLKMRLRGILEEKSEGQTGLQSEIGFIHEPDSCSIFCTHVATLARATRARVVRVIDVLCYRIHIINSRKNRTVFVTLAC